jgi:glutathione synthase/RimK-type ligase-like ATP-grasp enzyme
MNPSIIQQPTLLDRKNQLLGVFVNTRVSNAASSEAFFWKTLSERASLFHFTVFFFTSNQVDWKNRKIHGFYWDLSQQTWNQQTFRYPDFIYDRNFSYKQRTRATLSRLLTVARAQLLQRQIPGKWRMHQLLLRHPQFSKLLPQTLRLRSYAQIERALLRTNAVLLKPRSGSHGRGIMRIRKRTEAKGGYEITGRDFENQVQQWHTHDVRHCQKLKDIMSGRAYLLQPFLKLQTNNEEPYDVRAFTQRTAQGEWLLRGLAVRIGQRGGITANLAGGARARAAPEMLSAQQRNRIRSLSVAISRTLARHFRPCFEFGLDFAVAKNGRLYLLEVNGKPGRDIFRQIQQMKMYEHTVDGVFQAAGRN